VEGPEKSFKYSPGAIYDIDFITSFLLIKHSVADKRGSLRDRLWRCVATGALDKTDAGVLDHAAELLNRPGFKLNSDQRAAIFHFDLWNWDGTLDRIHHALYVKCREAMDREASPTACVIDSQSVKSAEKGGATSIRAAMMLARRSKARSAISWSIR
jgi:hypothetical protein